MAVFAQPPSLNFHHLTTSEGLSDPAVKCITQDKYGYIWLGTQTGLNRFNGYDVKIFQHKNKDSFSLDNNNVISLFADIDGDIWIGLPLGLSRYDYRTGHFVVQRSSAGYVAIKMLQADKNNIYVGTIKGLALLNKSSGSLTFLHTLIKDESRALLRQPVNDFCIGHEGTVYITTDTGLVVYDPAKITARKIILGPVKNNSVNRIVLDKSNLWISYEENSMLLKTDTGFKVYNIYRQFKNDQN
ncbi:MAG: two-component regulator propeller domain-containing protein, partial [Flavitalea sp.]